MKPSAPLYKTSCAALAVAASLFVPGLAAAQSASSNASPGAWRYSGSVYVFLPTIDAKTSFPPEGGGPPINIDAKTIIENLKMTFMGSLDAHNGRWGVFTDIVYVDLGNAKTASRDFTIGDIGLPAGTTANLDFDLKAWVWTTAGEYRVSSAPALTVDLLGGARMIDLKQRLVWDISGNLGPIAPAGRSGSGEKVERLWDGIVGVKARYAFGDRGQWSMPLYLDVGAGQSDLTWQAAAGIAYAFKWGEMSALWRHLEYDLKPGSASQSVSFSGPMLGATWRW